MPGLGPGGAAYLDLGTDLCCLLALNLAMRPWLLGNSGLPSGCGGLSIVRWPVIYGYGRPAPLTFNFNGAYQDEQGSAGKR